MAPRHGILSGDQDFASAVELVDGRAKLVDQIQVVFSINRKPIFRSLILGRDNACQQFICETVAIAVDLCVPLEGALVDEQLSLRVDSYAEDPRTAPFPFDLTQVGAFGAELVDDVLTVIAHV